jgi:hypothetical protein
MGLSQSLNGAVDKLSRVAGQNRDKIDTGIHKATSFASQRTGRKYDDTIRTGSQRVRDGLDKLTGDHRENSTTPDSAATTRTDSSAPGAPGATGPTRHDGGSQRRADNKPL